MKNNKLIVIIFAIVIASFATTPVMAQFGELFGGDKKDGKNPLESIFGGGGKPGGGKPGGSKPGGSKPGGGIFGAIGGTIKNEMESEKNTTLGPVGSYVLGRKLGAMMLGRYKTINPNDPRVDYVRSVAYTLSAASNNYGQYGNLIVILLDEPKIINAFAAPGGFIFCTTGMLNFIRDEDELAFVLGHEIAHIELSHGVNAIKTAESGKNAKKFASRAGLGGSLEGILGNLMNMAENGFGVELEAEADIRGALISANAGYDPRAAGDVIKRLEAVTGRAHATGYPDNRVAQILKAVRNLPNIDGGRRGTRKIRYKKFIGG
jgi:predicted Zn-dependent protease